VEIVTGEDIGPVAYPELHGVGIRTRYEEAVMAEYVRYILFERRQRTVVLSSLGCKYQYEKGSVFVLYAIKTE
jgi:hypothetical protein